MVRKAVRKYTFRKKATSTKASRTDYKAGYNKMFPIYKAP